MISPAVKIFLCAQATDMRRSFDKLAEMTRSVLAQDPLSGHLFVFFNRRVATVHPKEPMNPACAPFCSGTTRLDVEAGAGRAASQRHHGLSGAQASSARNL